MTAALLVLLGLAGFAMMVGAIRNTHQVKTFLARSRARSQLPKVITTLVISVQFSELLKMIDHVSVTHIAAALLLLAVMLATRAGTEGDLNS